MQVRFTGAGPVIGSLSRESVFAKNEWFAGGAREGLSTRIVRIYGLAGRWFHCSGCAYSFYGLLVVLGRKIARKVQGTFGRFARIIVMIVIILIIRITEIAFGRGFFLRRQC